MPKIVKGMKETSLQTRKNRNYIAAIGWKKVDSWVVSKQKSSAASEFFKDNKYRRKKRSKKKRDAIEEDKWPRRQKPTWLDLGRYYSKVAVKQSGKIKQTWKRKEHKPG